MGHARWDNVGTRAAYTAYATLNANATVNETFERTHTDGIHKDLDPKYITVRESRDSAENPNSTPLMVALDVTGSMGEYARQMAVKGLGEMIEGVFEHQPIVDPHVMFLAIGDAKCDRAPLQASQFEADIRIVQQLSQIYVEGGGGGNDTESYDLPWLFAAKHTVHDAYEKRGQKGFLFTIGDEMPPAGVTAGQVERIFGHPAQGGYTAEQLLEMASERYEVFHIIVEEGSFARGRMKSVMQKWRALLGRRALPLSDHRYMPQLIVAAMLVSRGADIEDAISRWQDEHIRKVLRHAFSGE